MTDTDFVVIRAADPDTVKRLPPDLDGRWYERGRLGGQPVGSGVTSAPGILAMAHATDRYETRDSDGVSAQVYEIRLT
jgi:hypothetical protein